MQDITSGLWLFLLSAWAYDGVKFIVSHTLINLAFGLMGALKTNVFDLDKVLEFMTKKLLPYVGCYYVVKLIGTGAGLDMLALPIFAIIEANLLADLLGSLKQLGISLPGFLGNLAK